MTAALVAGMAGRAAAGSLPCSSVIAFSTRLSREAPSKSRDPIYIGRKLDVHPLWVERCFAAYGRRVSRHVRVSDEDRERIERAWETAPVEKAGPEEVDARGLARAERRRKRTPQVPTPSSEEEQGPVTEEGLPRE